MRQCNVKDATDIVGNAAFCGAWRCGHASGNAAQTFRFTNEQQTLLVVTITENRWYENNY